MEDLINYSDTTDHEPDRWSHTTFKNYFIETFHKVHNVGGAVPWSMKEQVLLKHMLEDYDKESLANMILYWHTACHKPAFACNFTNFYTNRVDIYHKMKRVTGEYSWD